MKEVKFQHRPNPKQKKALELLYDKNTKYLLFGGGAGGGKSWLGSEWLLAMCLNFPGVRYFIAREELKSLKDTTIKTFFKVAKYHVVSHLFRYYEHYSSIKFSNGSEIQLIDLKYLPSDPLFERYGSLEFTGGFIDEGGEVHFNAFDTLKSRIGRQLNEQFSIPSKILITCNPKKNWLYHVFYKPIKSGGLERGYDFIQSLASENTKIDRGYIENLDSIKDKTLKQRLKYGEWEYEDDPSSLVDYESIISIFSNDFVNGTGKKMITADIARFGADKTVARVWDGFRVLEKIVRSGLKVTESANEIKMLANKHGVTMQNTLVDDDGVGGGVVDILKCKGFVNNSSPLNGENFDNLKSQCGFKMADIINADLVYEQASPSESDSISEELQLLKQKNVDSDKRKGLISKEMMIDLIGHSPNHLDTYIMRGFFEIKRQTTTNFPTFHR